MIMITRREFALGAFSAATAVVMGVEQATAAPVALDPADPTAKALAFAPDSAKVDAAANPTFKPTQKCLNCAQYQGKASDPSAPCTIFGGKTVPAAGWCKVWVQRPAG